MFHKFNQSIFRAYDIRGIVAETLSVKDAYYIGQNFAKQIKSKYKSCSIVVGYDGRLSSPILEKNLLQGMYDAGAEITRIGVCSSPMLYYSTIKLQTDGGIMITGSHNPANYNGFKILSKDESYYGKKIVSLSKCKKSLALSGKILNYDISNSYIKELTQAITTKNKKLSVVWDPGNGATGELLSKLVKHIPGNHIIINSTVDGTFPSHHPDPTDESNLKDIKNKIAEKKADIGIAFDGDGDRIGVVDSKGNLISGDKLLLLFSLEIIKKHPGAKIIGDVKTSDVVFKEINKNGGKAIMWKTGHSLIKAKMKETGALLAGEMSGHIFFADNYYGFDDAMYAAIRLLNIVSKKFSMNQFLNTFKNYYSTPEIKVFCEDKFKFLVINQIKKRVSKEYKDINLIDGIRVNTLHGWWLIRASNTQPALIVRCEANDKKNLRSLINDVQNILVSLKSKIPLNIKF